MKCKYLHYKAHSPNAGSVPRIIYSNSPSLQKIVEFHTSEDQNPQMLVYAGINLINFIYTKSTTFPSRAKCRCSDNLETFFNYNLLRLMNRPSRSVFWAKRPPWLTWWSQVATGTTADFAIVTYFSAWNASKCLLTCQFTLFSPKKGCIFPAFRIQ